MITRCIQTHKIQYVIYFLFVSLFSINLHANSFIGQSRNTIIPNQNAFGFGYYNEPVVYEFSDSSENNYVSNYQGWLLKYARYFGPTSALMAHYVQANGEENIREVSGSLVYGINLNQPGISAYAGVSYTIKQRAQFVGEPRVNNVKETGWDYPVGIQLKGRDLTFSIETRYKHFVLQGENVAVNSARYPLFFSVLMNF